MITQVKNLGYYIDSCGLPGETKAEEVIPAQHNTLQLSRDRWFVFFNTRGFRGNDDHRSVVYQVRADHPRGKVLSEGYLDRQTMDWDPLGDGSKYVKLCTHLAAFGVPLGARIDGHEVAHAGTFAAFWTRFPRVFDAERNYLLHDAEAEVPDEGYRCVWVQFELDESGDDIRIIQPLENLVERGYEDGPALCRHEHLNIMNCGYVNPVPYNGDHTEWVFLMHWNRGNIDLEGVCTPIRFRWDPARKRYAWDRTGPMLEGPGERGIFEGGIAPWKDDWLIAARTVPRNTMGNAWFRMSDLFGDAPEPFLGEDIRTAAPRTIFRFADGAIRVLSTDQVASPYAAIDGPGVRMPLHFMEIDPDHDFRVVRTEVIFDSVDVGLPIRLKRGRPCAHFCQMIPHTGGTHGMVSFSVRPKALRGKAVSFTGEYKGLVRDEEIAVSGVYCSELTYDQEYPAQWDFPSAVKG